LERRIARARRREYQVLARAPDFFIGVYQRVRRDRRAVEADVSVARRRPRLWCVSS